MSADHRKDVEKIDREFHRLILDEKGWKLRKEDEKFKVYSVKTASSTKANCFKCVGNVNVSPDRLMDMINPFGPYRPQFDSNFVSTELIEELNDNTVIGYQVVRPSVFGIGLTADSINVYHINQKDAYIYNWYGSIKYNVSKSNGMRGWLHPCGFAAFRTEDPNVSRVVTLWHVECASLPSFLTGVLVDKTVASSMIQYLNGLEALNGRTAVEPLAAEVPLSRWRAARPVVVRA